MKTALVTGASRGIGRAIAYTLAKNGYNLYLTCEKNIEMLSALADSLSKEFGITAVASRTDVSDYNSVSALFETIPELDAVINNAGKSYVGLLSDMNVKEWSDLFAVNLNSAFYTSKFAIPLMLKKHSGSIINISSVWGNVGASMEVAYSATKGGLNAFTRSLAKELAPSNIAVNAIACGFVDTEMNAHLSAEDREEIRMQIPADRFTTPEEIAQAVLTLLNSPSYLTGQVITVDGGWT